MLYFDFLLSMLYLWFQNLQHGCNPQILWQHHSTSLCSGGNPKSPWWKDLLHQCNQWEHWHLKWWRHQCWWHLWPPWLQRQCSAEQHRGRQPQFQGKEWLACSLWCWGGIQRWQIEMKQCPCLEYVNKHQHFTWEHLRAVRWQACESLTNQHPGQHEKVLGYETNLIHIVAQLKKQSKESHGKAA